MTAPGVVIVGASLAGLRAAETLRAAGVGGDITLVGAEEHRPYDRPPLSKQLLTGKVGVADIGLAAPAELGITWKLGAPASGVDLAGRYVELATGEQLPFGQLVIATGSTPRHLTSVPTGPGHPGPPVHVLRTVDDALAIREVLQAPDRRVVVIGAGVIGLEVASSSLALGHRVTVLEAAPVALVRVVGPRLGAALAEWHRAHGVDLRTGVVVEGVGPEGVRLAGGETVPADLVVVGVGAAPETGWLAGSGLDLDDGVMCDASLRALSGGSPVPGVVAAGDVARWELAGRGPVRLEHWTNAVESATAAASALVSPTPDPFAPVPYVWSDQHGRKLQVVGLPDPDDEVVVVDGALDADRWVAALGRRGKLVAAIGLGRPAKVMALRAKIAAGADLAEVVPDPAGR